MSSLNAIVMGSMEADIARISEIIEITHGLYDFAPSLWIVYTKVNLRDDTVN